MMVLTSNLFIFQHVLQHYGHVCWWLTALYMARTIRWRRPGGSVTPWCITSVRIIGPLLLLVRLLLLVLHLGDVMNHVTHIVAAKTLKCTHHRHSLSHLHLSSKNILTELINHDVTNLHGLLHLIALANHRIFDHQLRFTKCGHTY